MGLGDRIPPLFLYSGKELRYKQYSPYYGGNQGWFYTEDKLKEWESYDMKGVKGVEDAISKRNLVLLFLELTVFLLIRLLRRSIF